MIQYYNYNVIISIIKNVYNNGLNIMIYVLFVDNSKYDIIIIYIILFFF